MRDRVSVGLSRTLFVWNSLPGAVAMLPEYSDTLAEYPFYSSQLAFPLKPLFTAVIYATSPSVINSVTFNKLMKSLAKSKHLDKVSLAFVLNYSS